jgi:DNA polymerase-3 subunit beta
VLVQAEGNLVRFTGSNLEINIEACATIESEKDGAVCLPVKLLISYLSLANGDEVEFEKVGTKVKVTCGRSKSMMAFVDASEFAVKFKTDGQLFSMECSDLRRRMEQVKYAQYDGGDLTRFNWMGISFWFSKKGLEIVATNGGQLTKSEAQIEGEGQFIVPTELALKAFHLLDRTQGNAVITFNDKSVAVTTDDWTISGKLIDGKFPNYHPIISGTTFANKLVADRIELMKAIQGCGLFTSERNPVMRWKSDGTTLGISFANPENEYDATVDVEGSPIEINLPPDNLISALDVLKGDKVEIRFTDHLSPIQIIEDDFMAIIMPIRSS